jgi:hypothetical protein
LQFNIITELVTNEEADAERLTIFTD